MEVGAPGREFRVGVAISQNGRRALVLVEAQDADLGKRPKRRSVTDRLALIAPPVPPQCSYSPPDPLSPRIVALKEILGMLRPEPERPPLPPRRHYEPPSQGRYGRRR